MKTADIIQIKGFLETSFVDWPGKVCAVVFLPGCNFRCPFCHNGALVLDPFSMETVSLDSVMDRLREYDGWIDGVCITGGEPTIHKNLPALIERFKDRNLAVKLDTNGTNPAMLEALMHNNLVDCIAMDIKAPLDRDSYARLSGCSVDIHAITTSIDIIRSSQVEGIFRTTIIPEMMDEEDVCQVARYLAPGHRLLLQQFNPLHTMDPSLHSLKPWNPEKLDRLQRQVDAFVSEAA